MEYDFAFSSVNGALWRLSELTDVLNEDVLLALTSNNSNSLLTEDVTLGVDQTPTDLSCALIYKNSRTDHAVSRNYFHSEAKYSLANRSNLLARYLIDSVSFYKRLHANPKTHSSSDIKGYVESINEPRLTTTHKELNYTKTKAEAAALSIIAGTDLDCGDTYNSLNDALTQGLVTIDVMDRALERLFHVRLTTHEDDHPASTPFPDNRDLALRASLESMVLLQNDGILPLQKGMKVAIVGPTVDILEDLEGNYHGTPRDPVSTLDAAYDFFGAENVTYAQGSLIDDGVPLIVPRSALRTPDGKVGLRGEYFNNTQLTGQPALVRNDHTIDFDTDYTPLFDAPNPWDYSVRWTGSLVIPGPGTYHLGFNNDGDNSVLLYVEGQLLLNTTGQKVYEKITFERSGAHDILRVPPQVNRRQGGMRFRMEWMAPVNVQLKQMVQATAAADVVVVFVGLSPSLESEETGFNVTGFVSGDRSTIRLPNVQRVLLKALEKLRKPVVLVLNLGSAVVIDWATRHARAALAAWYSGELGGKAIIDTLVGRHNPAGRLPITFYRSDADLPPFKSYEMEGRTYRYFRGIPLYPFGHGLSYTTFSYSGLVVPSSVRAGDDVNVTVTVRNTGDRDGDEVIQVYLRHYDGATPKKVNHALVAFQRVTLKAGEKHMNARCSHLFDLLQCKLGDNEGRAVANEIVNKTTQTIASLIVFWKLSSLVTNENTILVVSRQQSK
ncbi:beta-glucosidase [Planoprotostelium fungivorum]|uniref:Beta-glucosidase n=1 Tax=Planoprotostelium fungivorum TaxID=1890364 RepID=A0A2P6NGL1_9EUKA|nr:beta-glucosidase [Planoprotostelium fungivorum]